MVGVEGSAPRVGDADRGPAVAGWDDPTQAADYLERMSTLPPRGTGEQVLLDHLPDAPTSLLDLGCGDGRLAALVLDRCPSVSRVVALDRSPPMLELAARRFRDDERVLVRAGDLNHPIGPLGSFDLVVSGFAIHHLEDQRKRSLFREIAAQLTPGGRFFNLEVTSSSTPALHRRFLSAIGRSEDDPEDRLATVTDQMRWMTGAGLGAVQCLWRWRSFALLTGLASAR